MPRKARAAKEGTVHKVKEPVPSTNGFDPKKMKSYVGRHQSVQHEIDDIMKRAQDECIPLREDLAAIVKEAANEGLPKKEFKAVLRKLRLEEKVAHVADSLDKDQTETYEMMLEALGQLKGTPLGDAAVPPTDGAGATLG